MLKKIMLLTLVLVVMLTTVALGGEFRDVDWGMKRSQVIALEDKEIFMEEDGLIMYDGINLFNEEFILAYYFVDNKLTQARYLLNTIDFTVSSRDLYNLSFDVPEMLTEKYGEPVDKIRFWHDDYYEGSVSDFKYAVSIGDFEAIYEFGNEDITVYYGLMSEDGNVASRIEYYPQDPELIKLREQGIQEEKEETKNQL